jgi:hypothetical protein
MSALSSVASIASAVAPAVAAYFGKSRSSKRRYKNRVKNLTAASRGNPVPSAPPSNPRRRRGGRGRRRRNNQRSGKSSGQSSYSYINPGPLNSSGLTREVLPMSVAGKDFKTYYRQAGTPVHKEWGEGCRFIGCSVFGTMDVPASGGNVMIPNIAQQGSDGAGGTLYFNLYNSVSGGQLSNRVFALHPALIARLGNECNNWGKYCFRRIMIHSEAVDTSTDTNGYIAGLSHDVSWPLRTDQTSVFSDIDVAELGTHATGPFWRSFSLSSKDYNGDGTWPTALPIIDLRAGSTDSPPSGFVATWAQNYYQYFFATVLQGNLNATFAGTKGFVYISYIVDFYSVQADTSTNMQPIDWNSGVSATKSVTLPRIPPRTCREVKKQLQEDVKEEEDFKSRPPLLPSSLDKELTSLSQCIERLKLMERSKSGDSLTPLVKPTVASSS